MRHRFVGFCVGITLMCLAAATMPTPSGAVTNLLANPGFESAGGSYSGWFTFGSGVQLSTPATDNIIRTGVAAAKIYGGFTGCPGAPLFSVGGFGQAFTPTAGKTYEFSGFGYVASTDPLSGSDVCNSNRLLAKIVFFNAATGGSELQSNEIVVASGASIKNQWYPFTVSAPAPTGALRVEALFLFLQPGCDTGSAFVDDASFTVNATVPNPNVLVNPSFTTGLTGWSTFGNVFTDARSFAVRTRTGCAKLFSTFVADTPSGMYQSFATTPGTSWEFGAYALNTCQEGPINGVNDNQMLATITFRNAFNVDIGSTSAVLGDKNTPLGTWTRNTVSATAPAGTAKIEAYILFVSPSLFGGSFFVDDVWLRRPGVTDVAGAPRPNALELRAAAPNPFLNSTRIEYSIVQESMADLSVYDITGRRVETLFHGQANPGPHVAIWDGRSNDGRLAPTGIYRYVLQTAAGRMERSVVLSR